jgi:hypothetical protein
MFEIVILKFQFHYATPLPALDPYPCTLNNWFLTELALHLCRIIGEHGAGQINCKDIALELFENLEMLLYGNLATR